MAGGALLLLSTFVLVRAGLLSIRYGLGWSLLGLFGILGAPLLELLSRRVGELGFTSTGFSLGVLIVCLGLICLQLSTTVSGLQHAVQDLGEYSALLEQRLKHLEDERGAAAGLGAGDDEGDPA